MCPGTPQKEQAELELEFCIADERLGDDLWPWKSGGSNLICRRFIWKRRLEKNRALWSFWPIARVPGPVGTLSQKRWQALAPKKGQIESKQSDPVLFRVVAADVWRFSLTLSVYLSFRICAGPPGEKTRTHTHTHTRCTPCATLLTTSRACQQKTFNIKLDGCVHSGMWSISIIFSSFSLSPSSAISLRALASMSARNWRQ